MPITYVLKINVPSDQSVQQYKETLEKRLVTLKPKRLNKFHVQSTVYQAAANASQQTMATTINQFIHSDFAATCFTIYETAAPPGVGHGGHETKILTGDIGLASINRRISELGLMSEKKALQMECMGSALKIGDFQVKIGAVTHHSSNLGLLIEVLYTSAITNQDAYGVLNEFVLSFFGFPISNDMLANSVRQRQKSSIYTPEDTVKQYYEHFNNMRQSQGGQIIPQQQSQQSSTPQMANKQAAIATN